MVNNFRPSQDAIAVMLVTDKEGNDHPVYVWRSVYLNSEVVEPAWPNNTPEVCNEECNLLVGIDHESRLFTYCSGCSAFQSGHKNNKEY